MYEQLEWLFTTVKNLYIWTLYIWEHLTAEDSLSWAWKAISRSKCHLRHVPLSSKELQQDSTLLCSNPCLQQPLRLD